MLNIVIGFLAVLVGGIGTAYAIKWGEKQNIVDLGGQGRGATNKGAK